MTISNQNVEVYRGDTETVVVTLTDANGDPFVLSPNGNMKYRVSQTSHEDDGDAVVRKDLNNGILLDAGEVEITLSKEDTDLEPGLYYHELKVFDVGDVSTAMIGTFIVRRSLRMTGQMAASNVSLAPKVAVIVNAVKVP